jgi:hypothetical protein
MTDFNELRRRAVAEVDAIRERRAKNFGRPDEPYPNERPRPYGWIEPRLRGPTRIGPGAARNEAEERELLEQQRRARRRMPVGQGSDLALSAFQRFFGEPDLTYTGGAPGFPSAPSRDHDPPWPPGQPLPPR